MTRWDRAGRFPCDQATLRGAEANQARAAAQADPLHLLALTAPGWSVDGVPVRAPRVLAQQAQDEVILLSLDDGAYFTLNEVGSRVWELCDGSHTTAQIVDVICAEFDAPVDVVTADVLAVVQDLASEGLVAEAG